MKRRPAKHQETSPRPSRPAPAPLQPVARDLAFDVLCEYQQSGAFVSQLLEERFRALHPAVDERRLATELAAGVVRRQSTLDLLLEPLLRRPRHRIEAELWALLRLGAYQLAFLTAMPTHAAVHETVELARRIGRADWCGFANGLLRGLERKLTDEMTTAPASDALPLTAGDYRKLTEGLFPAPENNLTNYIASAFSFPYWLVDRWQGRIRRDDLLRMAFWFNTPALPALRVNRIRTSREEMLARLQLHNIPAESGELEESIRLTQPVRIESLPGFLEGFVSVQDETAMRAAHRLDPQPGERLLDLCAAPGAKTTHLAERMNNSGSIIATDVARDRLQRVVENSRRLGTSIIETRPLSEDLSDAPDGPFDAVLLDVPCTNTGVLGKRPEARWRLTKQDVIELAALQRRLLDVAATRVRSGGRLLYSTCSIEPKENEQQVARFLKRRPEFALASETLYMPGLPSDGGYQALLRRA